MIDWLKENIIYLSIGFNVLTIILFLISLIWKKVPTERLFKIISLIPSFINSAEQLFPNGNGEHKKQVVHELIYNIADKYNCSKYLKYIDTDKLVEEILTTPRKKN